MFKRLVDLAVQEVPVVAVARGGGKSVIMTTFMVRRSECYGPIGGYW